VSKPGEILDRERLFLAVDEGWLASHQEEAIDPDLPIIDPHHHLWDRSSRYLLDEVVADVSGGHNVIATVFVQCEEMYRVGGDPNLAPVGETEFANGVAAMSASGKYGSTRICAGIVGAAELRLGARVDAVLEAHLRAGGGRFRGIRQRSVWDADASIKGSLTEVPKGLLLDAAFRTGFARLSRFGLSFDAWLFHPQIPELTDLASAYPQTPIILDHAGAALGIGAYADRSREVFADWRRNMAALSRHSNVTVKLGGFGMHLFGFDLDPTSRAKPATSQELARLWRPYVDSCIELFGPDRCMFESNFPVDKRAAGYTVLWNAFKRLVQPYSEDERAALLKDTARRVYRL